MISFLDVGTTVSVCFKADRSFDRWRDSRLVSNLFVELFQVIDNNANIPVSLFHTGDKHVCKILIWITCRKSRLTTQLGFLGSIQKQKKRTLRLVSTEPEEWLPKTTY